MRWNLKAVNNEGQLDLWAEHVEDPRSRVATGFSQLDSLLHRGGFTPGTLVLLGGRTRTRKTTTTANLIVNMLRGGVAVGLVGLDEAPHSYVAKVASALSGVSHEYIEENWTEEGGRAVREQYEELARNFVLSVGYRPDFASLSSWLDMASVRATRPKVVFIDYVSLLTRDKYAGQEVQRVARLIEELQVWTNQEAVVTIALHQVGRMDEGTGGRYHGDTPLSLESLKFGGEEIADVVLGTYRPALSPVGNMDISQAKAALGQNFDEDTYYEAVARVKKYRNSTFLQVVKNRPGTRTNEQGIELLSVEDSMKMIEKEDDA